MNGDKDTFWAWVLDEARKGEPGHLFRALQDLLPDDQALRREVVEVLLEQPWRRPRKQRALDDLQATSIAGYIGARRDLGMTLEQAKAACAAAYNISIDTVRDVLLRRGAYKELPEDNSWKRKRRTKQV